MKVAATFAPVIAAMAAGTRRKIVAHFFVYHALSPEEAVPYVPQTETVRRQFDQMLAQGILNRASTNAYWVDRVAYQIDLERRRRTVLPLVLALILLCALLPLLFYQNGAERGFLGQVASSGGR